MRTVTFRRQVANLLYSIGHVLLMLGAWANRPASGLFRISVLVWPEHKAARAWHKYLQGIAALSCGESRLALSLVHAASQELPEVDGIRGNLGLLYALNGVYDEAIRHIEAVFRESARLGHAGDLWAALVWSYLRTGRVPSAISAVSRATSANVCCPRLELLSLLASGTAAGAIAVGDVGGQLCLTPNSAPMVLEYVQYIASKGEYHLARQLMQALPASSRGRAYTMIAQSALDDDDLATALWAAQLAENTQEAYAATALVRSEIALRKGRGDTAVDEAKKAMACEATTTSETHEQLGRAFLVQGQWAEAAEQMIEALHTGAVSALAAGVAALAAIGVGDFNTAKGLFRGERLGDSLGVACAHVAQCRIMDHGQCYEEVMKLAGWAMDEMDEFPSWAATAGVIRKLSAELEFCLSNVVVDEAGLRRLNGLRGRLTQIRSRHLVDAE